MKKIREYKVHDAFLKEYGNAAIENAQQILDDAKALLANRSFARAYFLAVAAIEEAGKAHMAFIARGRNLSDAGLKKKVKELFEDHSHKITAAFAAWILKSSNPHQSMQAAIDLMIDLKRGREKSMYVDASGDNSISIPHNVVRPTAAIDSIRVAENCVHHTKFYIEENQPPATSSFDDKFFCLKSEKLQEMFSNNDFGKYLLSELKQSSGNFDLSRSVVTYHDKYWAKGQLFTDEGR